MCGKDSNIPAWGGGAESTKRPAKNIAHGTKQSLSNLRLLNPVNRMIRPVFSNTPHSSGYESFQLLTQISVLKLTLKELC
jgi:hypothetical protein